MTAIGRLERALPDLAPREAYQRPSPPPEPVRPTPSPPGVLAAGNHAVARMLARYGIAAAVEGSVGALAGAFHGGVETLTRLATQEIRGSVGRKGQNDPVDIAVVRALLNAAGFGEPDLDAAIERYQREKLGWHLADGRVDPGGKTIRALRRDHGHGADGARPAGVLHAPPAPAPSGEATPAPSGGGAAPAPVSEPTPSPAPAPVSEPTPSAAPGHGAEPGPAPAPGPADASADANERVFRDFAAARAPLYAAMHSATDDEARRAATQALAAFDAQHLPQLRALQQSMGGRWDIKDTAARDAVLAAIQLEAATDAMGDMLADSETVHKRVAAASGMPLESAWCGMFTVDHFRHSGMDKDLAAGFLHVDNVQDFFTYRHDRNPKRIPKWIWAEHAWHDLHGYHQERSSEREWLDGKQVWAGGDLDIRPGDVALIDHNADGKADHIVKVQSYDPATSTLLTIGGNDAGWVIDRHPKLDAEGHRKLGKESAREQESRTRAEAAAGGQALGHEAWHGGAGGGHVGLSVHRLEADGKKRGTIFGIGRPSLVDFEDHPYDKGNNLRKPPAPLKE